MMRKLFILLLVPAVGMAQSPKEFKLEGKLNLAKPIDWVYVSYRTTDNTVTDSFQLKDGKFAYSGQIEEPTLAMLRVKYAPEAGEAKPITETVQVFVEEGKIGFVAKDSLKNHTVSKSKAHSDYLALQEQQKPYTEVLKQLGESWSKYNKEKNTEELKKVDAQYDSVSNLLKEKVYRAYAVKNPQSPVALFAVKQYAGWDIDADKVEPLFNALPATTRQWPSAVVLQEQIAIAKKTGIGKPAMDFTQADTSGVPVSLSSFRGKYVLVDFWASWCGPCRAENPNVVKVFNQYKDKGFTVLGVSLDRPNAKDKWLKAIYDDGLAWTQVSDLKFWDNEVAKQYGIKAIPQNLLIDPQGVIIAKNLRGEDLEKKLGEVFK